MGVPQEKEERQYTHPIIQMTKRYSQFTNRGPYPRVIEITTQCHFRLLQLAQIFIKAAFPHRLLGIGTPAQNLLFPLLKLRMIVLLSLLLW